MVTVFLSNIDYRPFSLPGTKTLISASRRLVFRSSGANIIIVALNSVNICKIYYMLFNLNGQYKIILLSQTRVSGHLLGPQYSYM